MFSGFGGKPLMTTSSPSHICSRVLQDQSSLKLIIIERTLISPICLRWGVCNLLVMMFLFLMHRVFILFSLAMCSRRHLIEFFMVKEGLKCVKLVDGFSFLPPYKAI